MKVNVGIDLGTTYSAVATFDKNTGEVKVLKNDLGNDFTPSVVYIEKNKVVIGQDAKDMQAFGNQNTAAFYKTWMGDQNFNMYLDGKNYSSEQLSGLYLKELIKNVEKANNVTINEVVITVPAYFNEAQRNATINAGKFAGLNVLKIINEPTAAIIAYGLADEKKKNIMVYDLGGGTFDVTIAEVKDGVVSVLGTNGDHQLGGKNWDLVLIDYFVNRFSDEYDINITEFPEEYKELQVNCENIKKKLSSYEKLTATIQCDGRVGKYEITRETFDELTSDLLEKTKFLIKECLDEIRNDFTKDNIDEIVLVGGSTRMPQVREMIFSEYGKNPITNVDVDTIVAKGAAIQAAICTEKTIRMSLGKGTQGGNNERRVISLSSDSIKDVTAHSLGLITTNEDNTKYINTIIIPKNMRVPSTQTRPFKISNRGNNLFIDVYILQGESDIPLDNHILGKYVIDGIEKQDEKEIIVDISYTYNENGMVIITARQRKTNKELKVTKQPDIGDYSWVEEAPKVTKVVSTSIIYLTIDLSGSMSSALKKVEDAAYIFIDDIDITTCKIGLLAFADKIMEVCKPTNDIKEIKKSINKAVSEYLGIGYGTSAKPLEYLISNFNGDADKKFVVVLTDGAWFKQSEETKNAQELKNKGIDIIALGFASADEKFLQQIASSDKSALKTDLNGLASSFSSIAQAITDGDDVITIKRK